ncbi:ABC transporter permease [Desulfitobacterium sp. PCE1]|uniref:ABC transporter permease n=1 Tax=Desulfitobacterium sp. PCE1 TaxID=146907 RepID=UPI000362CEDC|nr:ABC transporter permease subunit [Desulfitobacterium sp. PCE1]
MNTIRKKAQKNKQVSLFSKVILLLFVVSVLFPIAVIMVWSFIGRWPWPRLWPENFSTRGLEELFGGYSGAMQALGSSILLSIIVALLAVIIGAMTARALVFYDFLGKKTIAFGSILPIIVPGTVFGMGIHVLFIRVGLADNVVGVILVHLICALPYSIKIMTDITAAFGCKLEEQAETLGAAPRQILAYVTFPALLPGLVSSACMAYIISFSQYFLTLLIGGGQVRTFSLMMVPFLQSGDRTVASAYSLVFIGSTLLVFVIFEKALKKFRQEDSGYFFI